MTVAASLALWLLAAAPAEQAAENSQEHRQENRMYEVRDQIAKAAFDPSKYFSDEDPRFDLIHITYRGDDYDWPFYAIAVRNGCFKPARADGCEQVRKARMVKVPVTDPKERPRNSGNKLVYQVMKQTETGTDLSKVLDASGLQWVEADLRACPGAMSVLAEATKAQWV